MTVCSPVSHSKAETSQQCANTTCCVYQLPAPLVAARQPTIGSNNMATAADQELARAVAQAVQQQFQLLPKTGKNQPHEHSVIAGIVAYRIHNPPQAHDIDAAQPSNYTTGNQQTSPQAPGANSSSSSTLQMHVIALGTGTKCLGASKRSASCDVINDSHAEVVTRRAFVAWVYHQLRLAVDHLTKQQQQQQDNQQQQQQQGGLHTQQRMASNNQPFASAFYWSTESCMFKLHNDIRFAMYVSQPPCGDAAIFEQPGQQQEQHQHQKQPVSMPVAKQHVDGDDLHSACCSTSSAHGQADSALERAAQLGNDQQHDLQQVQVSAGRTGAKLIRLAGTSDVRQAAAALDALPPAASESYTPTSHAQQGQGAAGQQQQHESTQQDAALQQQQQFISPTIPSASDVESGPQQLGVLRRKPGKGDPTLSLSCSDKIARWVCLGMQGCLLSSLLAEPLHLSLLAVAVPPGATGPTAAVVAAEPAAAAAAVAEVSGTGQLSSCDVLAAAEAAGRRAFAGRLAACASLLEHPFAVRPPAVVAVQPADSKLRLYPDGTRKSPSGVSINWSCQMPLLAVLANTPTKVDAAAAAGVHEVTLAAHGRKAGAGRKSPNWSNKKTQSRLCPAAMYQQWQALLAAVRQLQQLRVVNTNAAGNHSAALATASFEFSTVLQSPDGDGQADNDLNITSYRAVKKAVGQQYQQAWSTLRQKSSMFAGWLVKP